MKKYVFVLTATLALTATPAGEAKQPETLKGDAKKVGGVLTPESLGEMLKDLAYEPEDVSLDKKKDAYKVTTERDGWKIFINVSLSADRTVVWFEAKFNPLADPDAAPAAAWLALLQLTDDHAPAHFTFDNKKRIRIKSPLYNHGITPGEMRRHIERFEATVRSTEPYWKAANFSALPKLAALTDAGRKNLEKIAGTWVVVEEQRNGKKSPEADVKESVITYVCAGDKCRMKSKYSAEIEATLWADIGDKTIPLDLVFLRMGVIQKAIVKVEGDTMTICVANPNMDRPTVFAAPADFKGRLLLLKRQKP